MKTYCGNNRPYTYVSFPAGKKEQALSVLEKLTASEEGKKLSFWYTEGELGKKEKKRLEAASSLLIFAGKASLSDERFKQTVDTATNYGKPVLCVHLEELAYDTPWAQMQLSPQQAIGRSAYTDEDSLAEKLSGAEIFRGMRVTKEQKRNKRGQMAGLISVPVALALCVLGYLYLGTDIFVRREPAPVVTNTDIDETIVIPFTGISGTQAELDKITELYICAEKDASNTPDPGYLSMHWSNDNYSTFYFDPKQITTDNKLDYGDGSSMITRGTISDLSWLQYMPNLEILELDGQRIKDITPVFQLKKLRHLSMTCNFIESLEGIEVLENLETVNFAYNKLTDVSSLFRCPKIYGITIPFNFELTDLGCDYAPNVVSLDISFTKVGKVPVIGADGLWYTGVQNRVTDYSFLKDAGDLNMVILSGNVRSTLLPAIKDKKVGILAWEYADIESMQELADSGMVLTGPGVLTVNRSELKSLEGIENIKGNIKRLTLFENDRLSDISPIKELPKLKSLGYVSRTGKSRFNVEKYCEENNIEGVFAYASGSYMIYENLYYGE